jgi:hypothetical protein
MFQGWRVGLQIRLAGFDSLGACLQQREKLMKYGLLDCESFNLGDEIQALAAAQYLPRIDLFLNRNELHDYDGEQCVVIGNGWYDKGLPPSDNLLFLPISMHFDQGYDIPEELQEWSEIHGPIGCRGQHTLQRCEEYGYFSGCLTTTFPEYTGHRSGVVLCEVHPEHRDRLERLLPPDYTITTHEQWEERDPIKRLAMAQELLTTYKRAELVLTSRLHCALPCHAMGTPCVLLNHNDIERTNRGSDLSTRTLGLERFLLELDIDELASAKTMRPWHYQLPPVDDIPNELRERCIDFIDGFSE